jgi:hypothetical protein
VDCAEALTTPVVVTVTVVVGQDDAENVEDTEDEVVTVGVTVNVATAVPESTDEPVAPAVTVTVEDRDAEKVAEEVMVCVTDADTVLEPLPVLTRVLVAHGVGELVLLIEVLVVLSIVGVPLPESDAEEQGVGVIEGV